MIRRATSVSIASSVGSSKAGGSAVIEPASLRNPIGLRRPVARRDVEAGLGTGIAGRVAGQTGPLGDDPRQLADLELGALVAQQRQPDPLAPDVGGRDIDREQALVVERRREQRGAVRADDLGAAPERDRLVDPDAVAEDHEASSSAGHTSA